MPTNRSFSDESYSSSQLRSVQKKINNLPLRNVTGSTSLIADDENMGVEVESATATNITVPNNSAVPFPIGTFISIIWFGTGQPSIVPGSGVTIHSDGDNNIIPSRYKPVTLYKRGTNEWYLWGIGSTGSTGGGGTGDTTPPTTVGNPVATDAHTIAVTFSESVFGSTGFTWKKNGVAMTITGTSTPTSTVRIYTLSETMLSTDTITYDYAPGNIVDGATTPNPFAPVTGGAVTNSIAGGGTNLATGFSPMNLSSLANLTVLTPNEIFKCTVNSGGWDGHGKDSQRLAIGADGALAFYFVDVASSSGQRVGFKSDGLASANYDVSLYNDGTNLYYWEGAGGVLIEAVADATWYAVFRESGVYKAKKSTDGTTWTTIHTYTSTAGVTPGIIMDAGASCAGVSTYRITYPQKMGLS